MGWSGSLIDGWMRLRDRRGPMAALVLFVAYLLLILSGVLLAAKQLGFTSALALTPLTGSLLLANAASLAWRSAWRGIFTAREYGAQEGVRAVLRIPIGNLIAILAGRRAIVQYVASLRGAVLKWDKTEHSAHPSLESGAPA